MNPEIGPPMTEDNGFPVMNTPTQRALSSAVNQ
jgi:hypothetical protein